MMQERTTWQSSAVKNSSPQTVYNDTQGPPQLFSKYLENMGVSTLKP